MRSLNRIGFMDLNDMNPVLLVAALTQQIAEQEKRAAACSEDAENKAALSKNLLRLGNLLIQMGDKEGAGKDRFAACAFRRAEESFAPGQR